MNPEITRLRVRLAEAEETLRAIRSGEVDAVLSPGRRSPQVFTLEGAGQAYRVLIETMNEGALTLTVDKTILYANACFAKMVKHPLEQVTGSSFRRFLSNEDRAILRPLMKRTVKSGSKIQVMLNGSDGSHMPVQISLRPLARKSSKEATVSMVVTDMTEARRTEELLRALTRRVVEAQEVERGRLAHELHDTITQQLCAVLIHSQILINNLSKHNGPAKAESIKLHEILGKTVEEVERISRNLRPSVLEHLGLVAGLQDISKEFSDRTGISVKLVCVKLAQRLTADTELILYRILQESLKNVQKHAGAGHVTVHLTKQRDSVQLRILDDGIGLNPNHTPEKKKERGGLGLLGMRERASSVGGVFTIKSMPVGGTKIEVRVPLPSTVAKQNKKQP